MEKTMVAKFRKLLVWVRDAWLIVGITVALFLFIEIVLSVAFHYRDAQSNDYRVFADTYQNADWPKQYYKEFRESSNSQWLSYVYWRRKPYQGQYISIDSQGIRKTWSANAGQDDNGNGLTIFFFGGSTMWGTGARDNFTIPSIFAKQLAKRGINAQIINFGETGYVSTQEMILLIRELQKGNIPDGVIFYDGVNDTYSAYQQARAGLPHNEFNRVKEFNSSRRITSTTIWASVANDLSTIRFLKGVYGRLGIGSHSENAAQYDPQNSPGHSITNKEDLANDVLNIYERNIEVVNSLAERYSFKALFYWQPNILEKMDLTEYEKEEKQRYSDRQPFFDMTYELLRRRDFTKNGENGFHDLSMLFSDVPEPLFVDWFHLGETGNEYIAERLVIDALSIMGGE